MLTCPFCKREIAIDKVDEGFILYHPAEEFEENGKTYCCPIATPPLLDDVDKKTYGTLGDIVYASLNEIMMVWGNMSPVEITKVGGDLA